MNAKNIKLNEAEVNTKNPRNIPGFDRIDILIIGQLLKNMDVKSSEICNELKIPLSTIQRRRARIDKSSMMKRGYKIDYKQFGVRRAQLLVTVSKGDCVDIARKIVMEYPENVLEVSIRIGDPQVNFVVEVIYNDSDEIFNMIQYIKKMEHVEDVRWSEIITAVVKNDTEVMQKLISKFVIS